MCDASLILELYRGNPLYFFYLKTGPTAESVCSDLTKLPPGKSADEKYYLIFRDGGRPAAVMDLILGYPAEDTAFIGLFMMSAQDQGKGIGTEIISGASRALKSAGFRFLRLGRIKGNPQSEAFWRKNGFFDTGEEKKTENFSIILMQKKI